MTAALITIAILAAVACVALIIDFARRFMRMLADRAEGKRVEDARLAAWVEAQAREDAAWVNLPCGCCGGSTQPPGQPVARRRA